MELIIFFLSLVFSSWLAGRGWQSGKKATRREFAFPAVLAVVLVCGGIALVVFVAPTPETIGFYVSVIGAVAIGMALYLGHMIGRRALDLNFTKSGAGLMGMLSFTGIPILMALFLPSGDPPQSIFSEKDGNG